METKENNDNNLEFRYSRSHRLESAPQIVKDYYSGDFQTGKKGFFKFFFQNMQIKILFYKTCTVIFLLRIMYYFVIC